jgi:hypothetical protein
LKYITFTFENLTYWIETDEEGWALRQIITEPDGTSLISCRDECLAEGIVFIDEDSIIISEEDFEKIWEKYSLTYKAGWDIEKNKYSAGMKVEGYIKYFYPQGIIIQLDKVQGITDYNVCRKNSSPENLYPGHKITGTVTGWDNKNMWIILSDSTAF